MAKRLLNRHTKRYMHHLQQLDSRILRTTLILPHPSSSHSRLSSTKQSPMSSANSLSLRGNVSKSCRRKPNRRFRHRMLMGLPRKRRRRKESTILSNCRWDGTESRFLTGCTSYMAWVWNTNARYVQTISTWAGTWFLFHSEAHITQPITERISIAISKRPGTHSACGRLVFQTPNISTRLLE